MILPIYFAFGTVQALDRRNPEGRCVGVEEADVAQTCHEIVLASEACTRLGTFYMSGKGSDGYGYREQKI